MKKRIIAIAVLAVMALGVFAFMGCDLINDLSEYKVNAISTIEKYAETKIAENGYTEDGLQAIAKAVTDGKAMVDAANTKKEVDEL